MIGKLIIVGAVIVIAAIFLIPGISNIIHNFPSLEAKEDTTNSNKDTLVPAVSDSREIQPLNLDQADPKYVNKQVYVGQVFEKSDGKCKVSVPDLVETINGKKEITHILEVDECKNEVNDPVEVTKLVAKDDIPMPVISTSSIAVSSYSKPSYFDVIQLTSTHKGSDVLISYNDASGNTIGVVVTLRNSDKEIFS